MEASLSSHPACCKVLWSTQSGRAKACARRTARISRERCHIDIISNTTFDDDLTLLANNPVKQEPIILILMVSTTGDGEQCESIQTTWKSMLSRSLPHTLLEHVKFALYCLGDRAYGDQFCAAGRKLATRLVQLGAKPLCRVGYGDDGTPNGGVFYDLDVWLEESLLPVFQRKETIVNCYALSGNEYNIVRKKVEDGNIDFKDNFFSGLAPKTAYCAEGRLIPMWEGVVKVNNRLSDPSWQQNTRHIAIQIDKASESVLYQAGDVCTILPCNSREDVEKLLQVLPKEISDQADNTIELDSPEGAQLWPRKCTLRSWLTYCADIAALPEREDLRALSFLCPDTEQRVKLLSLSETSGSALYADYVLREKRSWRDVLYDFDSITLSLSSLFQLLQPLRPRHFSIASAPSSDIIELCVAVVEGTTPLGRSYHGLCSSYLRDCTVGDSLRLWLKPGSFQLPMTQLKNSSQYETPILCIGAGTGIAPLRSLIREREKRRQQRGQREIECDAKLIFGCRKESMDYYYQEEWKYLQSKKRLQIWTAFSRDQTYKNYVQQEMSKQKSMILEHILEKEGAIYVAGGAKMASAVKEKLLDILEVGVGDRKRATNSLKQLSRKGKYAVEAWS